MLAIEAEGLDDPSEILEDENDDNVKIEVVLLGEVGVDSGQLMITDPCYVDSEWQSQSEADEEWWSKKVPGHDDLVSLTARVEEKKLTPYSYRGAAEATLSGQYGELAFKHGHTGAGVAFATAWGDGIYPVYGELHNGRITRVYITTG